MPLKHNVTLLKSILTCKQFKSIPKNALVNTRVFLIPAIEKGYYPTQCISKFCFLFAIRVIEQSRKSKISSYTYIS